MRRKFLGKPRFTISKILAWADLHFKKTGKWPKNKSGPLLDGPLGDTWGKVDIALRSGFRGLEKGSSLAQLLAEKRGVRNIRGLATLTDEQILTWADNHFHRTQHWPNINSGKVYESPEEFWQNIDVALREGCRGLPGNSSLAQLLEEKRGVPNRLNLPNLTEKQILFLADSYYRKFARWPTENSFDGAGGTSWKAIDSALQKGTRGLPGGESLAQFLARTRGVRNHMRLPRLTFKMILSWVDLFHQRTGCWPNQLSGPINDAPGETWSGVDHALKEGRRGFSGGSSLAQLLAHKRGVRYKKNRLLRLTLPFILLWADCHFRRTGKWPTKESGRVVDAPGETWRDVDTALKKGLRGLEAGNSLSKLLKKF